MEQKWNYSCVNLVDMRDNKWRTKIVFGHIVPIIVIRVRIRRGNIHAAAGQRFFARMWKHRPKPMISRISPFLRLVLSKRLRREFGEFSGTRSSVRPSFVCRAMPSSTEETLDRFKIRANETLRLQRPNTVRYRSSVTEFHDSSANSSTHRC